MNTLTDDTLSLTSRVYRWRGSHHLAVSLLGAFGFADGEFLPEAEVWNAAASVLAAGLVLEEGFAKPGREFFVSGSAFPPPSGTNLGAAVRKAEAVNVTARVGGLSRSLRVTGDRHWQGGPTAPEVFSSLPVDWAHAWGGPGSEDNPLGKGLVPDPKNGLTPLANVVDPEFVPSGAGAPPAPASFLPLGAWPARNRVTATDDQAFLASGARGFPDDFHWSWFMTAHPKQRGSGEFAPSEEFAVTGMHPSQIETGGRLPTVRPWSRVERVRADGTVEAVPMQLVQDTVWLFPEREMGVLVWHGVVPVADDEASEVLAVRAGFGDMPDEMAGPPDTGAALAADPPPAPPPPPPPVVPAAPVEPPPAAMPAVEPEEVIGEAVDISPRLPDYEAIRNECQAQVDELINVLADAPGMADGDEELDMVNTILAEQGREPLTEEAYRAGYENMIDELRRNSSSLVDQLAEEAAAKLAPIPPGEGELSDEELADMLMTIMTNAGVDRETAAGVAAKAIEPIDIGDAATLKDAAAAIMGVSPDELPFDPDQLLPDDGEAAVAEKQAALDAVSLEHFGKDFDTLMDPDDDTIPTPRNREDFEAMFGDSTEIAALSELLDAIFAEPDAGDELPPPAVSEPGPDDPPPPSPPPPPPQSAKPDSPSTAIRGKVLEAHDGMPAAADAPRRFDVDDSVAERDRTLPDSIPREPGVPPAPDGGSEQLPPPEDIFGEALE